MSMARKRTATSDAIDILHRRFYAGKPKCIAELDKGRANEHTDQHIVASWDNFIPDPGPWDSPE